MNKRLKLFVIALICLTVLCICVAWIIRSCGPSKIIRIDGVEGKNVAKETAYSAALPDGAVLELNGSKLTQYTEGKSQCLVKNVAAFCLDGTQIIYLDKESGGVYALDAQMPSELFGIDLDTDSNSYFMLASNKWIVLRGWRSMHIYHRDTAELDTYSLRSDINGSDAFIIEDKLLCVGEERELFTIMDLPTGAIDTIDVGIDATQCPTTASCVYDGNRAYLSVRVRSWPVFGIKYDDGTYAIDLTSLQAEKLSNKYFESLYFSGNYLYGGENNEDHLELQKKPH